MYLMKGFSALVSGIHFSSPAAIKYYFVEFPERPGALRTFLLGLHSALNWNISLFHYRNHGAGMCYL